MFGRGPKSGACSLFATCFAFLAGPIAAVEISRLWKMSQKIARSFSKLKRTHVPQNASVASFESRRQIAVNQAVYWFRCCVNSSERRDEEALVTLARVLFEEGVRELPGRGGGEGARGRKNSGFLDQTEEEREEKFSEAMVLLTQARKLNPSSLQVLELSCLCRFQTKNFFAARGFAGELRRMNLYNRVGLFVFWWEHRVCFWTHFAAH